MNIYTIYLTKICGLPFGRSFMINKIDFLFKSRFNSNIKYLLGLVSFLEWQKEYIYNKFSFVKEEYWIPFFEASTSSIPHYKKREKGGEDYSFQSENLLVVADGVGGWNELGIDPAAFSKELVNLISRNFEKFEKDFNANNINENGIKQLISKSVKQNKQLGSSTVAVIYLEKSTNSLFTSYIGDSCYLIARPISIGRFELIFKAEEQTHGFNIPYQVGQDGDNPRNAITQQHKIKKNDLIILATDGLWDNLDIDQIIQEINKISLENKSINLDTVSLAKRISELAEKFSLDRNYLSPFAKRALDSKYKHCIGGKPDDITVVVAQICDETEINIKYNDDNSSKDTSADMSSSEENKKL